jgi:hypothetical protein
LVQISLDSQVPQVSFLPQPSSMVPQVFPALAQVLGTQVSQRLSVQVLPSTQVPQSSVTPSAQADATLPHSAFSAAQVGGLLAGQAQLSVPPHPSDKVPQMPQG